ncbi:MAG TPA: VWA domain-containing protein [Polyangiaceae bacterium]|nr:VWA domain-containing protein [Polyangiaceae bacterium]
MRKVLATWVAGCFLTGCAGGAVAPKGASGPVEAASAEKADKGEKAGKGEKADDVKAAQADDGPRAAGPWVGAAPVSDVLLAGTAADTQIGVWVDVPTAIAQSARPPANVALVVDTSGSMAGLRIVNARHAARAFVDNLADGDIVSLISFDDIASERLPPTQLAPHTRPAVARAIESLRAAGGTNLFDGLRLGEARAATSPPTHLVRRVVLLSDGRANVGPANPAVLGEVARRGAERGVQVTSLGVGEGYDETTLNALAVASSGRLYHIDEAGETASILERELALLRSTAVTDAFLEIVPAPGVELRSVDGAPAMSTGTGLRVPLGAMFAGQHREMLVRARVYGRPAAESGSPLALASVRLHFRDSAEGGLERVHEVVTRYRWSDDPAAVGASTNGKVQTIAAALESGQAAVEAARRMNEGDFRAAEQKLAEAEARMRDRAARATSADEKKRANTIASSMAQARTTARAAAAAPPAGRRSSALRVNDAAMDTMGY